MPKIGRAAWIYLLLTAATVAVYGQVRNFQFTNFDDSAMVPGNPLVRAGLTAQGLWWGLTTSWYDFWHPMVWWSLMLDCQLFGLKAGWHHLTNLAFHVANTLLLFVLLKCMTKTIWRSAMVAALFALHPLHVESVAWIAERKDVLSAFFFLLALLAYVAYVRRARDMPGLPVPPQPTPDQGTRSVLPYLLSLFFFALGLMSKSMIVTTPCVLLLLDYWPLCRLSRDTAISLVREKIPFFALSLASCIITFMGMRAGHNLVSSPWSFRIANAFVSYARYLGKAFWPVHLMPTYPTPDHWAFWPVACSVLLLVLIWYLVVIYSRSARYLVFGWLFFLGTLVPVIGLVAMSRESMADRYTYIPSIGLFVAVVWAIADATVDRKSSPRVAGLSIAWKSQAIRMVVAVALLACAWLSWIQAGHWRDNLTLWTYCLNIEPDNAIAHYSLGCAYQDMGRVQEAAAQYRASLDAKPDNPQAALNLGAVLAMQGNLREATNYFGRALMLKPGSDPAHEARAHENLGIACVELGNYEAGLNQCREAVRLDPQNVRALTGLARALGGLGRLDEAIKGYADALRLRPSDVRIYYYLGLEYEKHKMFGEAAASLAEAVRLAPNWEEARRKLEHVRQAAQR